MIDFITGFIFCWFLVGAFAIGGLLREWPKREIFWIVLALPALPFYWALYWITDLIRRGEGPYE